MPDTSAPVPGKVRAPGHPEYTHAASFRPPAVLRYTGRQSIRSSFGVFRSDAAVSVFDTGDDRILGIRREYEGQVFLGLFNFSEHPTDLVIEGPVWTELISCDEFLPAEEGADHIDVHMDGYAFFWLLKGNLQKKD